jgi:hypothetical protein
VQKQDHRPVKPRLSASYGRLRQTPAWQLPIGDAARFAIRRVLQPANVEVAGADTVGAFRARARRAADGLDRDPDARPF